MKVKIFILFSLALLLFSCTGKKEEFVTEQLSDYLPMQPGKYITYRLDSLVFTNFGTVAVTNRYQVKHEVDAKVTDNLGRPSYRVFTYIRDSAGTQPWEANGTYMVTELADQTEVIEDNYRVIKLHLPIKEGYQWFGNHYLPTKPYYPTYNFNLNSDLKDWEFYYDVFEPSITFRGNTYNDVFTVQQADERQNGPVPVTNPNDIGFTTQAVEKFSKSIGLVYRKYEIWDYQITPNKTYTGFGVTMWMIDHN